MKITKKLTFSYSIVFIINFILSLVLFLSSIIFDDGRHRIVFANTELVKLMQINDDILKQVNNTISYLVTNDKAKSDSIINSKAKINAKFNELESIIVTNKPFFYNEKADLIAVKNIKDEYNLFINELLKIVNNSKKQNIENIENIENIINKTLNIIEEQYVNKFINNINEIINKEKNIIEELNIKSNYTLHISQVIAIIIAIIASLIVAGTMRFLIKTIVNPLKNLTKNVNNVNVENFYLDVELESRDEIGILAQSFNNMARDVRKFQNDVVLARDYNSNVIESLGDMLVVLDYDFAIKTINKSALKILGYEKEEITNKKFKDICQNANKYFNIKTVENDLRNNKLKGISINFIDKKNTLISVNLTCSALYDLYSNFTGIVCIARDMREIQELSKQKTAAISKANEIEKLYKELKDTQHKLLQSQKMESMGKLASGVAHDFNNLLGGILGFADILRNKLKDNKDIKFALDNIVKSCEKASSLVQRLLTASHKSPQFIKKVFNINKEITETKSLIERVVDKKIDIQIELDENLWDVNGDANQISQAIMNLAVNSRDAMPKGGLLKFTSKNIIVNQDNKEAHKNLNNGNYVMFSVSDTGTGIPDNITKNIFDPFFTTKEVGKGTGLGLSMVYSIITDHNGIIEIEKNYDNGLGTVFNIYIPAHISKTTSETESSSKSNTQKKLENNDAEYNIIKSCKGILIADDEPVMRNLIYEILADQSVKLFMATNGEEAINIYKQNKKEIDLVILDLVMPKVDGFHAFDALRKENPNLKVVFSSGYAESDKIKQIRNNGNISFIQKPYVSDKLLACIKEIL